MSDNRSVATDALATLGTIIDDKQKRDAIHLAVEPVIAGEVLRPGNHVRINKGIAYRSATEGALGIVDPFLSGPVKKGERFWLVMYPRTINSLRHVWTHPDLPNEIGIDSPNKETSEAWLREFCDKNDCPRYDVVMEVLDQGSTVDGDEYTSESILFRGSNAHAEIPPEFWVHAEIVLGRKLKYRPEYFSCTC